MDFFISLMCGLVAYAIVMYGLVKALKKADKIDQAVDFAAEKLRAPWLSTIFWRIGFPLLFLYVVIGIVHKFVDFMNWITK